MTNNQQTGNDQQGPVANGDTAVDVGEVLGTPALPRSPQDRDTDGAEAMAAIAQQLPTDHPTGDLPAGDPPPTTVRPGSDHDGHGHFAVGNQLWRRGQEARIRRAVEVRTQRQARTKALLKVLTSEDVELCAHRLRGLMLDPEPKVALAAIKLVLDVVTLRDQGDVDPELSAGSRPTFTFVIPSAGLDVTGVRRVANTA